MDTLARARRLNDRLVASLQESGALTDPEVTRAFRSVLRHHFLPGRPLSEVYEDTVILTKVSERGTAISSSSQPAIMAIMLQQLRPQPGQRVLEIGAGTGYNAALLGYLVGPQGRVVTLDLDPDLCAQARANLAAAGITNVEVVEADGAGGWPPGAPYDRIIVTASADDLSPAWLEQLVEGGRLVAPLMLEGPTQLSIGFQRQGRCLRADSLTYCGFMPLRGQMAWPAFEQRHPGLSQALGRGRPTGAAIPVGDLRAGFEMWLALTEPGYVRVATRPEDLPTFGVQTDEGLALLEGEGSRLQVVVYGEGEEAARRLLESHRRWLRTRPSLEAFQIEACPSQEAVEPPPGVKAIRRPRFTFFVRPPETPPED